MWLRAVCQMQFQIRLPNKQTNEWTDRQIDWTWIFRFIWNIRTDRHLLGAQIVWLAQNSAEIWLKSGLLISHTIWRELWSCCCFNASPINAQARKKERKKASDLVCVLVACRQVCLWHFEHCATSDIDDYVTRMLTSSLHVPIDGVGYWLLCGDAIVMYINMT